MQTGQVQRQREGASKARGESLLNRKIVSPEKLKILVLAGNELMNSHLEFLGKCVSLIKLDLSHNYLTRLPEGSEMGGLVRLEVLQMHYNRVGQVDTLRGLVHCQLLSYLTLHHNPIENNGRYQHEVVNMLPALKLLNHRIVQVEERSSLMLTQRPETFIDVEMLEHWKSVENSEAYYLRVLNLQLQYIDNLWTYNNPIVIVQRAWRHFMTSPHTPLATTPPSRHSGSARRSTSVVGTPARARPSLRESARQHPLRELFSEWRRFSYGLKEVKNTMKAFHKQEEVIDKSYMLEPLEEYFRLVRNMRVAEPLRGMIKRVRRRIYQKKMAKVLLSRLRIKNSLFSGAESIYALSSMHQNHKLYFNTAQRHILDNFLEIIAQRFNKREVIYDKSRISTDRQFVAIRLVDPQIYANHYDHKSRTFSICTFLWPSMRVVITNRRKQAAIFKSAFVGIKQLTYIKNRDKVVSKADRKRSAETLRRLEKFAQNEYEQNLGCFYCQDPEVMSQLLRMIYYHNHHACVFPVKKRQTELFSMLQRYDESFLMYIDGQLKRTCAAVTIQKTWRRYISNRHQKESIESKMRKNRAALHIQRFQRNIVAGHRQYFNKKLMQDLDLIESPTLILPLSVYLQLPVIYGEGNRGRLFRFMRLTQGGHKVGATEEFFRPIFNRSIRDRHLQGRQIGREDHEQEIDIYQVLHKGATVDLLNRAGTPFIALNYPARHQAALVASIIALLSYQMWGRRYVFPLLKEQPKLWDEKLQQYKQVRLISKYVPDFSDHDSPMTFRELKEQGPLLYHLERKAVKLDSQVDQGVVKVEFYQKRYHNFPHKFSKQLAYRFVNCEQLFAKNIQSQTEEEESQVEAVPFPKASSEGLQINRIDLRKWSMYDQSERTIQQEIGGGKTLPVVMQSAATQKKQNVGRMTRQDFVKREAQKQMKESNLAGIRQKAKQEKSMNTTLRNLKEVQRTEAVRQKVGMVRQMKRRAAEKKEDSEFVQQNNFVMEQQLKMLIMRSRIKDAEHRKHQTAMKKAHAEMESEVPSLVSRRSSTSKPLRVREEESIEVRPVENERVAGEEGEVVNMRRTIRRTRAHSIGAYLRDPSFVHGVFPEEYYPIESRGTSFYFPPVP